MTSPSSNAGDRQCAIPWTKSHVMEELEEGGEWGLLRELIGVFLGDAAARIESLRDAAVSPNFQALARSSHALKGSALLMNAASIVEISRSIEESALLGKPQDYLAMVQRLDAEIREFREAISAYENVMPQVGAS